MIVISRVFVAKNCRSFALSRREENLQMNPFYEKKEEQLHTWVSENMTFPEHLHAHAELLLVLQGQIEVRVMEQAALLGEGDCAVIFPEQIHSYSPGVPNRSQLLIFSPAMAGPYTRAIQKYRPASPFLPSNLLPEDVFLSFRRLLALSQGQYPLPPCSADVCTGLGSAWIHVLLSLLIPLLSLEERKQPESEDLTFRLIQYITEHYQEPLPLDLLARKLHVNKYDLSRLFSGRLQMHFRQYLNYIRLEHVLSAMRTTDAPLTQLWGEAGFNSQRSFNRFFQETMGMTPTQYRQRLSR